MPASDARGRLLTHTLLACGLPHGGIITLTEAGPSATTRIVGNIRPTGDAHAAAESIAALTDLITHAFITLKHQIAESIPAEHRVILLARLCREIESEVSTPSDSFYSSRLIDPTHLG